MPKKKKSMSDIDSSLTIFKWSLYKQNNLYKVYKSVQAFGIFKFHAVNVYFLFKPTGNFLL